jgi:hypothetical protein
MTLIAASTNFGIPVMIGDVLISSTDSTGEIRTPTFVEGTGDHLKGLIGSKPYTFNRKLYIINSQLCIALGGRLDVMTRFLNRMNVMFGAHVAKEGEIKEYLDTYDKGDLKELSVIVLSAHDNGKYFGTGVVGPYAKMQHKILETVIAAGSGAETFLKEAHTTETLLSSSEAAAPTTLERVIQENLMVIAYCLGREALSAVTLTERWGAGFELIYYDQKKKQFELLNNFSVLLFYGEFFKESGKFEHQLVSLFKSEYQGDNLIIKGGSYKGIQGLFIARPINSNEIVKPVSDLNYQSKHVLASYFIKDMRFPSTYMFPTAASINDPEGEVVRITSEGTNVNVMVRKELTKTIYDYLVEHTK